MSTPGFKEVEETPFPMREGIFYHGMFYMDIPRCEEHILGGNVTALLWRLQDEPGKWRLTYRFRYNNSLEPDDRKDRKSWWSAHIASDQPDKILEGFKQALALAHKVHYAGEPQGFVDTWMIQGDVDRFAQLLETNPPVWMHIQILKADAAI